jgi:serine/threonine protein kinase
MNNNHLLDLVGKDINKYCITRYIGSGSFGDVFEAKNKKNQDIVALKIPIKTKERDGLKSLLDEAKVYKRLIENSENSREHGIAQMKVTTCKDRKIIVMDLLGESLESLLAKSKKFGIKTVILLAIEMIEIIKYIHTCGYIHRDLKPDNFVLGNEKRRLFCIDFGLAKKYTKHNGEHVDFRVTNKFCGTARYASIAAHSNQEQSRKDDLESIGYILVYLFKGKLPWQGVKHKDKKERYKLIGDKKEAISDETLCEGMPREFTIFLKYVRNLDFDEKPHYSALKNMFVKLYDSNNYKSNKLEWE